ncbi:thymidylate kinase [Chelonus insularis]|uniref:thymidylate kinase n=1 Tax=Chelonus insularis TaxID=460826 RepID=UPI0015897FB0|nr:thymidylate kinase [Chelonus insularis]
MERGALLVLEGCDRVGKSTQTKRLVQALKDRDLKVEARGFPDRTTTIGSVIDEYLKYKKDLPRETIHLLFAANRWEQKDDIIKTLNSGITLVVDRYAASGAAYSAASTNKHLVWGKSLDQGLPAPDLVAFLSVNNEILSARDGWAKERFENQDFQKKVAENFLQLKEDTWKIIEGNQSIDDVHKILLEESLKVIQKVKTIPIKKLYENESN